MKDDTFAYEMMNNIYTLCRKGYTIVRMYRPKINACGIVQDDGDIQITVSHKEEETN